MKANDIDKPICFHNSGWKMQNACEEWSEKYAGYKICQLYFIFF